LGPIALFDKSFLQALTVDEAVLFDFFFSANICPTFYVETLADLAKTVRAGKIPEKEVGLIVVKTPQVSSYPNTHHVSICIDEMMGYEVLMDGRPHMLGGRPVQVKGKKGFVFEESPESRAFRRWQARQFMQVERLFAKTWRTIINSMDLEVVLRRLDFIGVDNKRCKTLEEARDIALRFFRDDTNGFQKLRMPLSMLVSSARTYVEILTSWINLGRPSLSVFAPYTAYVMTVELFFYLAGAANLLSLKSKTDLSYLYYLPFCMVFISSDNFHRRCSPLFLRDDQVFVWGPDLKDSIRDIEMFYDTLPPEERERGLHVLASSPPKQLGGMVCQLWDRFMPGWRNRDSGSPRQGAEGQNRVIEDVRSFFKAPTIQEQMNDDTVDAMVLERKISHKRGKWWQLPKDFRAKDEDW
jgi:hypothetical protein